MRGNRGYFEEESIEKTYDLNLLWRMRPYVRPYYGWLVLSVCLVLVVILMDLAIPYVTKVAIDRYIVPRATAGGDLTPDRPMGSNASVASGKTNDYRVESGSDAIVNDVLQKNKSLVEYRAGQRVISLKNLKQFSQADLRIVRQKDMDGVTRMALLLLGLIGVNFVFNFLHAFLMEYIAQTIMHGLRTSLYNHIQRLPVVFFTKNTVGRLVTRVTNDVQNMHELFTSIITFVFKDFFMLSGIIVILCTINLKLALATFTLLPFVIFLSIVYSKKSRTVFRTLRLKLAEINSRFAETIGGLSVIQLFRQVERNYRRFKEINHENFLAGMLQIKVFAIFMPLIEILGTVSLAIIIFYGGVNVIRDTITLGTLVIFISYTKMFFRPVRDISEKYNILQNAMASAERIFLILDQQPEAYERSPQDQGSRLAATEPLDRITSISFQDVSFAYTPNEPVLKHIRFTLNRGETIALVGPTGSGKTTIMNLIVRFYQPDEGRITINGKDCRSYGIAEIRSKIGLVTQDPYLFAGTFYDNIFGNGPIPSKERIDEVLEAANCRFVVERFAEGLATHLREGGSSISSGERQLLSIGRAIAHDPEVIIFDEATSYIDSASEVKIQKALDNLKAGRTALIIAHRLDTARNADRILVLNQGRLIETGSHEDLMRQKGFYYQMNQYR